MAEVSASDCVADIGCGDGRVVIAAAVLLGSTGLGVDLDAYAVSRAQARPPCAVPSHLIRPSRGHL